MHVVGVDQRAPTKKERTKAERLFMRLNTVIFAGQLATLFITVGLLAPSTSDSMSNNFWTFSNIDLNPAFYFENCTTTSITSNGLFGPYPFAINHHNIEYMVARSVYNIRRVVAIYATFIGIGLINKLLFELNIHCVAVGRLILRKDILTVIEVALMVLSFICTNNINRENDMTYQYVRTCRGIEITNATTSADSLYLSQLPFVAFNIGLAISAFGLFLQICAATFNMWQKHPKDQRESKEDEQQHNASVGSGSGRRTQQRYNEQMQQRRYGGGVHDTEDEEELTTVRGGVVADPQLQFAVRVPSSQESGARPLGGVDRRW